jgi:hypothetical protein
MIAAQKALAQIQDRAEKIRCNRPQRFPEAASPGDRFRQGDLYITLLDGVPDGAVKMDSVPIQLAQGHTQGSRHCLDSVDGVSAWMPSRPGMLDGPIIQLLRERVVTHPEHGHVILPPGVYRISYQRSLDAEERERRVLD